MRPDDFAPGYPGQLVDIAEGAVAFVPNPLPPELTYLPDIAAYLAEAGHALGILAAVGDSLPDPDMLAGLFIHGEAVSSSRIEGTAATAAEMYALEAGKPGLVRSRDTAEVTRCYAAMKHGIETMGMSITLDTVRGVHERLMSGSVPGPGQLRTKQNWVGPAGHGLHEASYVAPPPGKLAPLLDNLLWFMNNAAEVPALVRIALAHYQFEAIRPFPDGNGRVGRILIALLLAKAGLMRRPLLCLSDYLSRARPGYFERLLAVSRTGDWRDWIVFFLRAIREQAHVAATRGRAIVNLHSRYVTLVGNERTRAKLALLVNLLFENPYVDVAGVCERLGVTHPTAAHLIERLAGLDVLLEQTGRRRGRVYCATELLRLISADN
jgi:Fic family protein